jgi:hypothetical protein
MFIGRPGVRHASFLPSPPLPCTRRRCVLPPLPVLGLYSRRVQGRGVFRLSRWLMVSARSAFTAAGVFPSNFKRPTSNDNPKPLPHEPQRNHAPHIRMKLRCPKG